MLIKEPDLSNGTIRFQNSFLNTYLEYVEDTESPRIFHIWSAIAAVGACLGRRVYLPWGIGPIFANNYILLVGPPAVRKSTAMMRAKKLLTNATKVRFAPDDTGGQRQGLIGAMLGEETDKEKEELRKELGMAAGMTAESLSVDTLNKLQMSIEIDPRDKHCMFATSSEFASFIGTNASEILTFLIRVYDGDDYDYRLKSTRESLENPLLSILGCTNPTDIATSMPAEAIGKGLMSRIILVHAREKYKLIARPKPLDPNLQAQIEGVFRDAFYKLDGAMEETPEAQEYLDGLYAKGLGVNDPRFVYYSERRHMHLIKTGMCLAAGRGSMQITATDYREANLLLQVTESAMPEALGEYGLSPLATAKQRLVEFIAHANEPVGAQTLWAMMHRDIKAMDFQHCLSDLVNANQLRLVDTPTGKKYVTVEKSKGSLQDAILALLDTKE